MKNLTQLLSFLLFIIPLIGQGQNQIKPPHPVFTPFSGTVYKMPRIRRQIGKMLYNRIQEHYGQNIYDYEEIGKIGLKQLNIPETAIQDRNFPGVKQKIKFAMIINAEVKIELDACYEFSLSSDDGSILWIDSTLIVNNDGGHQMKMERDSMILNKGTYPVKVWYFQGMPDRYGLILDAKIVGKPAVCPIKPKRIKEKRTKVVKKGEKFTLEGSILFEVGKYELKEAAIIEIKKMAKIINDKALKSISISGHTDNTGNLKLNQELSLNRATAVMQQLRPFIKNAGIQITAQGKADTFPIADNNTRAGRAKDRRAEIILNP